MSCESRGRFSHARMGNCRSSETAPNRRGWASTVEAAGYDRSSNRVDVVFTGESCADAWIEKEVVALKEDGCPKVWVVTSDLYQQQAAHGAGAFVWSCKALVSEIMASQRDFEAILKAQRSTSMQGKLLECNLVPEVVDALKDLKKLLPGD